MSILFFDGFETVGTELGIANQADIVPRVELRYDKANDGGTPATDSFFLIDDDFSEGYALQMGQNSFSNGNYLEITPASLQVGPSSASTPKVIIGCRVHVPSVGTRNGVILNVRGRFSVVGTDNQFTVAYDGVDLVLTFGSGGGTRTDTVVGAFSLDNWHFVEVKFKCAESANGGMIEIRVDGTVVLSQDPQDMNNAASLEAYEYFRFQTATATTNPGDYTAYDDIYILNADVSPHDDYLGPVRVRSIPPNSDQDIEWENNTVGNTPPNYSKINENGADDTTYVESDVQLSRDRYNITDLTEPDAVLAVKLEAEAINATGGTPSLEIELQSGSTVESTKVTVDDTVDYAVFVTYHGQDPNTSGAWTNAAIDAIRAGFIFDNEVG
jgi:hypothetical protein